MYNALLFFHSLFRWLVLASLVYAIVRGVRGWPGNRTFSKWDNTVRHSTATIVHVQLALGCLLYFTSPITSFFLSSFREAVQHADTAFFGLIHVLLMLPAIVVITIGSALTKRKDTAKEKFRTMTVWFAIGLLLILVAIPWPFSPLAMRPYFRSFQE